MCSCPPIQCPSHPVPITTRLHLSGETAYGQLGPMNINRHKCAMFKLHVQNPFRHLGIEHFHNIPLDSFARHSSYLLWWRCRQVSSFLLRARLRSHCHLLSHILPRACWLRSPSMDLSRRGGRWALQCSPVFLSLCLFPLLGMSCISSWTLLGRARLCPLESGTGLQGTSSLSSTKWKASKKDIQVLLPF